MKQGHGSDRNSSPALLYVPIFLLFLLGTGSLLVQQEKLSLSDPLKTSDARSFLESDDPGTPFIGSGALPVIVILDDSLVAACNHAAPDLPHASRHGIRAPPTHFA